MKRFALLAGFVAATSCAIYAQQQQPIDKSAMDTSVNPCDNFYQYACGGWVKNNPVPPEYARWGRFNELAEHNRDVLHKILEDAEKNQAHDPIDAKIGAYYESCMDTARIDGLGATPLEPELKRIRETTLETLPEEVARLHMQAIGVFFEFGSEPDADNAKMQIAGADQGGLGLPDKEFYFRKDPKSQQTREEYVKHIAKMFELLGDDDAKAKQEADAVMAIETKLASDSLNRVERRDPNKTHNKMSLQQFEALFPHFDVNAYLKDVNAPSFTANMNVGVPAFFKNLDQVLASTSIDDLRTYMVWHYVSSYASDLSKPFDEENFNFYQKYLSGTEQQLPRWKRCVSSTDRNLGELLGQKYVQVAFAGSSKEQTRALVGQVEKQMAADIDSISWMSAATKQEAMHKLHGVANKIGYPDKWKDYSSVHISPNDYVGNDRAARHFEVKRDIDKINQPADRSEWSMTPPTVNAYYNPLENNINFPAGILQPPFYSVTRDNAVNYGAVGAVIGHELTHGFDDEGRQFDADGNLHDWWTKQDEEEFTKRAKCISHEYSQFSPVKDVHLNGDLTLGENAADNGGVRLAFMALEGALANGTIQNSELEGFTPEQRFFLGYAQLWCQSVRPQEALRLAQTDPHSPGQFRVNGVVQNMPEFAKSFSCKKGDRMVSEDACRVW